MSNINCVAIHFNNIMKLQKSSGLIFSKSRTGSYVTCSYHHNWSCITFPTFVQNYKQQYRIRTSAVQHSSVGLS